MFGTASRRRKAPEIRFKPAGRQYLSPPGQVTRLLLMSLSLKTGADAFHDVRRYWSGRHPDDDGLREAENRDR
ncbi:hypothetical protein ACLBOM_21280 [Escherichia coli]